MPPPLDPTDDVAASISAGETSRLRRRPAVLRSSAKDRVTIFCGAESDPLTSDDVFESDYDEHRPASVQILPEYALPHPPRIKYPPTRSNGCGAPVHYAARAVRRGQRWYGWKENLEPTVVPLDSIYFPSETAKSLGLTNDEAECGCSISGIGCAICGNPLGTRIIRCATHSVHAINPADRDVYTFLPTAVSPATLSNANDRREPASDFPTPIARPPPPTLIPFFPPSTSASASASSTLTSFYVDPPPTAAARHPWSIPPTPTPTTLPPSTTPVLQSAPPTTPTPTALPPPATSALQSAPPTTPTPTTLPPPRQRRALRRAVSVERYFSGGGADAGTGADAGAVGANTTQPTANPWGEYFSTAQYITAISAPAGGDRWQLWPAWVDNAYSTTDACPQGGVEQRGAEDSTASDADGSLYLPVLPLPAEDLDLDTIAVDPDALRFASPSAADRVPTIMSMETDAGIVFPDSPVHEFRVETRLADARRVFPPSMQDVPSLADPQSFPLLDAMRSPASDSNSAPPTPTPRPPITISATATASATARARVYDIGRHLDALGARVTALNAAAADVRGHIESLRPAALASIHTRARSAVRSPSPAREVGVGFGVWAEGVREEMLREEAESAALPLPEGVRLARDWVPLHRASDVRMRLIGEGEAPVVAGASTFVSHEGDDAASPSTHTLPAAPLRSMDATPANNISAAATVAAPPMNESPHPDARTALINATRAAIAEERARLGELMARLTSLTAPPPPTPPPSLTVTSPPAAAVNPLSTATAPLLRDMRTLVHEQTDLLARMGRLVAEMGARVGALEGVARPAAGGANGENDTGSGSGSGSGGVTSALARAHAMLERANCAMRASWATFPQMPEWAGSGAVEREGRRQSLWEELMRDPWNPPSTLTLAAAELQRSAGVRIPTPPPPLSVVNASCGDRAPGGEDDKRPRRRMFFDR